VGSLTSQPYRPPRPVTGTTLIYSKSSCFFLSYCWTDLNCLQRTIYCQQQSRTFRLWKVNNNSHVNVPLNCNGSGAHRAIGVQSSQGMKLATPLHPVPKSRVVELYLYSALRFNYVVLNWLSRGAAIAWSLTQNAGRTASAGTYNMNLDSGPTSLTIRHYRLFPTFRLHISTTQVYTFRFRFSGLSYHKTLHVVPDVSSSSYFNNTGLYMQIPVLWVVLP
jgi:hypothetical protein